MVLLVLGSYDTKHFHPKLMEFMRNRADSKVMNLIRAASREYNPTNLTDNTGSTLLHYAAKEGNEVITMFLVSFGFNVNALDHDGNSPLMLAVLRNHVTTSEILIKAFADIYVKLDNDKSLVESVFDGTVTCYSHIIEMFVNRLRSEYSDVNVLAIALSDLKCPLYYVMDMKNTVITRTLLDNGCDINAQELRYGNSALHRAVYFKDIENVKLLLEYGADVNIKDKGGKIPWRCAPNLDGSIVQLEVLKLLLNRKPAMKSFTTKGRMQMYEIFVRGSESAIRMILHSEVDVSGKDGKGDTVFHYLAMNNNLSGLMLLPDKNYDVNARNQVRLTPLHVAAMDGNIGAMKFLLSNGANIDAKTASSGRTPLFCTIRSASKTKNECVELLLERGADVQFVTHHKKTVFDIVQNDDSVVRTLLAHCAMIEVHGTPILPLISAKINSCEQYKSQFSWFKKQLEEMKSENVDESLTLFELLSKKKEDIEKHVRKFELQLSFKGQNNNNYSFDPYYSNLLRKRVKRAMKIVELFN